MMTYEEIALEMGLTKSSVRRIEQRALRKLRKALESKGMVLSDLIPTDTHNEPEDVGRWDTSE